MTYRLRNMVLAVALAAMAAVLTSFYVANFKRTVREGEETVAVYVATRDIPAGTSGTDAVKRGMLKKEDVARRSVVPGAIASPDQLDDKIATEPIYADEQVSVRRFRPVEERGVRAELKGNVRAFQVPGDAHQLLAGTLRRGDRVDLVGNFKVKIGDQDQPITRTVLRDLLVLKAPTGSLAADKVGSSVDSYSVQLALTDAQAQKLFFTMKNGEWHLDVRSVVDASDSPESIETYNTVICDGMPANRASGSRFNFVVCFGRNR